MGSSSVKYICYNGDFLNADRPVLPVSNSSFRYGDALYENIHAFGTEAQFLDLHLDRLKQSMQWLKMIIPAFFHLENLSRLITNLLNKNRLFGGAWIRLTVFRNDSGLYAPENNTISFIIESESLEFDRYTLNTHGFVIDLYTEMPKPIHRLSSIKSTSRLLYVMAGIFKAEKGLDDCILINKKGHLVESGSSNLFILKNGHILTPGLEEGCIPGIMRQVIISCIHATGKDCIVDVPLSTSDLNAADEVFLTNAIMGIRWVGAFQHKRYYRDYSQQLVHHLNQVAFGERK
ncbi:MAG: aminotransferase class IV [Bacteroidales bacterium]|nr:aminotransferase class IV [Bacteroidales bacterium]